MTSGDVIRIGGEYYRLRYQDSGFTHKEDKGLWRADMVSRSTITGEWYPCDDDDYLLSDDRKVIAREIGWGLRREEI